MKKKLLFVLSIAVTLLVTLTSCKDGEGDDGGKKSEPEWELEYTLSDDGTYYAVTDMTGTCSGKVVIPASYEGLPVREIAAGAFSWTGA